MQRHRMFLRLFFGLITFPILLLGSVSLASAATPPAGTFIVQPAKAELTIGRGETQTVLLTLTNSTPLPLAITTTFEDIASSEQSSPADSPVKLLGADMSATSLRNFLSVSKPSFELLSGKSVEVPVAISIPRDIPSGGRYGSAVLSFHPLQGEESGTANVLIESRIAVPFYVRIAGVVKEEGALAAFGLFNNTKTVSPPSPGSPLRFQVAFENTGEVYLNPHGAIFVRSLFGAEHTIVVDPWAVLPGATRMRELNLPEELSPGFYRAALALARGYGDAIDREEVIFFVLPTPLSGLLWLIGGAIVIWLIYRSLRISRNRSF